jgi:hypothetical protein
VLLSVRNTVKQKRVRASSSPSVNFDRVFNSIQDKGSAFCGPFFLGAEEDLAECGVYNLEIKTAGGRFLLIYSSSFQRARTWLGGNTLLGLSCD